MPRFEINTRARRYRRYLGMALGRPAVGPEVVSLETTHHCNLRCSFCESHGILQAAPITKRREYVGGRRTMDLETIQRLAGELAEVGTDMVELSGKGDPIAHPQLTQIVMAIKDAGLKCAVVTNGTLAKPDLASTMVDRGLDRLNVSLNSGCRDVYLRSNKKDLWDKAVGFLTDVIEEKRRRGAEHPWIRISHVVTKENADDMEGMVRICINLGVDEVDFYVMGELPESSHLQLDDREIEMVQSGIERWSRMLGDANVHHDLHIFSDNLATRAQHGGPQENPLQKKVPCYIGWNFCVIGPDGVVVPCCYCEETKLGNVTERSCADIWYGALYNAFRRACLDMPGNGRWICEECFTTCNRAIENHMIYNKLHPFSRIPMETAPASPGKVPEVSTGG
jgi:MoaA/NifB/PqqE/SkfB family radical SAM enzyme